MRILAILYTPGQSCLSIGRGAANKSLKVNANSARSDETSKKKVKRREL